MLDVNSMHYLMALAVFFVALIQRSVSVFVIPLSNGFDTYCYRYIIKCIRGSGRLTCVYDIDDKYVLPAQYRRPPLLLYVLSLFPARLDNMVDKFFNIFLDLIFAMFIYFFCYFTFSSFVASCFGVALYLFTPAMFCVQSGDPRVYFFTPRLFAEIVGNLTFLSMFFWINTGSAGCFLLTVFLGSVLLFSSNFGIQAFIFISSFLSLFLLNFKILLAPLFSFVIVLLFTRGAYLEILSFQFKHLRWFFLSIMSNKMRWSSRISMKHFYVFMRNIFNPKKIYELSMNTYGDSILNLLVKYPVFCICFFIVGMNLFLNHKLNVAEAFVLSGVVIFFITSFKPFMCVGTSERYLNYIVIFVIYCLLNSIEAIHSFWYVSVLVLLMAYGLVFQLVDLYLLSKQKKECLINMGLVAFMKKFKCSLNVATVPFYQSISGMILSETKHNWLYHLAWKDYSRQANLDTYLYSSSMLDLNKMTDIVREFNIDLIIITKDVLDVFPEFIFPRGFSCFSAEDVGDRWLILGNEKAMAWK